jgi:sortase A
MRRLLRRGAVVLAASLTLLTACAPGTASDVASDADSPLLAAARVTTTAPTPPSVTAPSTTTTLAPLSQPVDAPRNPYQAEPYRTIGRIEIPKLGLDADLGEGIALSTINRGPSHWPGSALPGQRGNVAIAGHRVTYTRPFRDIDQLVVGDEAIFTVDGDRFTYRVTGNEVVTPDETRIAAQTETATATLFACHPPGSAQYRFVVYLALVT